MTANKEQSLQTKQETALTQADVLGQVGISGEDIVVPKILLMQNTSETVGEGKAQLGDFLDSDSGTILGGLTKPIEIIPIKNVKVWMVYDMSSGNPAFMRRELWTPENSKLPYEDHENGVKIRRDFAFIFTVLVKNDVDKGEAYPYNIMFKRTSSQAGRQLASLVFRRIATGKNHLEYSAILSATKDKNDKNYYAVLHVAMGTKVSDKAASEAKRWFDILKTKNVKDADETVPF